MTWKKVLVCGLCTVLLWFCSAVVGSLLNDLTDGPPGNIRNNLPFFQSWGGGAFLVAWVLTELWYAFLFFGAWVTFLPPRRWWSWAAFLLAATGAGLLASRDFQHLGTWDYELADGGVSTPPAGPMAIYANLLSCATALLSTTLCAWIMRRWFQYPSPNNALQRTAG